MAVISQEACLRMEEAGWNNRVTEADDKHTVLVLLSLLFAACAAANQTHDPEHARHCFSINPYPNPTALWNEGRVPAVQKELFWC